MSATRKGTTRQKPRAAQPPVPTIRTIKDAGQPKIVPFNPDRATTLYELNSLEHIQESLAFWYNRLHEHSCPECGVKGTLDVDVMPYGIEVNCMRADSGKCEYSQEIQFVERA